MNTRVSRGTSQLYSNPRFWYLVLFVALIVFTALIIPRLRQPIAQDEFHWLVAAETFSATGSPQYFSSTDGVVYAPHPHLYLFSILASYRFFGEGLLQTRIPGYLGGLLTILLVFACVRAFGSGSTIDRLAGAGLAALLYAVSPLMAQAAILIDDITILVPAIIGIVLCFTKFQQRGSVGWAAALATLFAVALWTRITTPPVAAGLLVLYGLAFGADTRRKLIPLAAFAIGGAAFLGTWYRYCVEAHIPFSGPFVYLIGSFLSKSPGSSGMSLSLAGQTLIQLTFWMGVIPTMVLCSLAFFRLRERSNTAGINPPDLFLVTGICLTLGFCVVGGAGFGFPKYHCPGLTLLIVAAGLAITKRTKAFSLVPPIWAVVILVATAMSQFYIGGDPLYLLRFTLRNQAVMGLSSMPVLFELGMRTTVLSLLFLAALLTARKMAHGSSTFLMAVLLSIGASLGSSIGQSMAGYQTGYNYGGSGTQEAARLIKKQLRPGSTMVVPSEILYYLNDSLNRPFPHPRNDLWTDVKSLSSRLTDTTTEAFAFSLPTNTVGQVKMLSTEPSLLSILQQGYEKVSVGTYTVWLRTHR